MAMSSQLVLPMTLWGKLAPTHCMSSIFITRDQKTVVSGCNDGQICVWDIVNNKTIVPRSMLFGHTAPVLCLSSGALSGDSSLLVSSSEAGEMSLWDLSDGRCLENTKLPYVHTNIQSYILNETTHLFCNGYYAEVLVLDVMTLTVTLTLTSRVSPDWISAMHVVRLSNDDTVFGLSVSGTVKVWKINLDEMQGTDQVYEVESKPIRCLNALRLTCCTFNQRTLLVVCAKYWQVYDAADYSLLCTMDNRPGERWVGGDFFASDRVVAWSDRGHGYLFQLPPNAVAESKDFHRASKAGPFLYCKLHVADDEHLVCPPAMAYHLGNRGGFQRILLRGDSNGRVALWNIHDVSASDIARLKQEAAAAVLALGPTLTMSLQEAWNKMKPLPPGILDNMEEGVEELKLTASVYLPLQGRLVVGREDGSIIIVAATQAVMLQLLYGKHHHDDQPTHQVLHGHSGKVTCLLYPHHMHPRYEMAHLVSGGVDFSVCLWDLYTGTLLHRFCLHAGEVQQLLVPPNNCSGRIQQCVCSIASDHSVALVGLKERKCVMLASRHLFPVVQIKWRPFDDFMVVGCSDGSVYVWQMETGHLDRVLQGLAAEDVLNACDEQGTNQGGDKLSNPALHLLRGLRHRNMAAIRHAAQRGLDHLHHHHHNQQHQNHDSTDVSRSRAHPLIIQGLRTNPVDQDSHVLFFDIEALIVQLLSEEYALMSPGTLEAQGLTNQTEHHKYLSLSSSSESHRKLSGFIAKVKDTAESAASKIQAKAESVGLKTPQVDAATKNAHGKAAQGNKPKQLSLADTNLTMEIAQLLLSLLHAWGLDPTLDKVCESKLGLLCPMRPICFGLVSRGGHMCLLLPTHVYKLVPCDVSQLSAASAAKKSKVVMPIPKEQLDEEERARKFSSRGHWELSTAMTTNHLLSVIALANTLMSMNSATFVPEQEKRRKLHRRLSRADSGAFLFAAMERGGRSVDSTGALAVIQEALTQQQAHIKQGWSLLAALHCVLLPDLVATPDFKRPQVEILARRWQDRCLEVREAAQALLLAELRRIGPKGRKAVVDEWACYLPNYGESFTQPHHHLTHQTVPPYAAAATPQMPGVPPVTPLAADGGNAFPSASRTSSLASTPSGKGELIRGPEGHNSSEDEDEEEREGGETVSRQMGSATEARRKQSTAIVLLAVIGAEYGHEIEQSKRRTADDQKKKSLVVDGFGPIGPLAWHTSQALAYLLLMPPSPSLPAHTNLRRAAIDLIGRGFTVWEAYLDVSRVLLALLELCCDSDKLVPSMSYGLPLTPAADSCRTARHALSLIATARPPAFITSLAREVARYNTLAQNAQSLNISLHQTVLSRARPEILRIVELLIDKMQTEVAELLVEVMDIVIHCLDPTQLKMKGLVEIFPAICKFNNVSYCGLTRRIAVGAKNGNLALYELRTSKSQNIPAHSSAVVACAFSPDGKYLSTYSSGENKLCFWQTAAGLFGLGNAQTRCVRTYATPPLSESVRANPLKMARLVWVTSRLVIILLPDGIEHRFSLS
ncbi:WD repeat-containing protein 7-like isoform X2 [Ornithodoros turicata]|uniref:WD repeat-containing protein 7-like isoform X2 n=1 Tax=Ornithodoros turicata TaxID=34597 RepID=UPI003139E439